MCIWWWLGVKMRKLGFNKQSSQPQVADLSDIRQQIANQTQNQESIQRQLDYIQQSELPNFVQNSDMLAINNELSGLRSELAEQKQQNNANNYVIKGENGTWGDTIPLSANAYAPTRLSYYNPSTQNRPNSYGTMIAFSSQGHFSKQAENWINTVAFGTDGTIKFCQSVNGGQTAWYDIYNEATTPNRQIITNGLQAGKSFRSGGQSIATGFIKGWAKMVVGNAPPPLSGTTVSHPFDRRKIINVSARIDGDGMSFVQGLMIEVHDNYFSIENNTANANTAGKPLTLYIEYEM